MPQVLTERFLLRSLQISDATPRYLSWFEDDRATYIETASDVQGLADLRRYIGEKSERDDVWFVGIFERSSGVHIGNLKYEPIDSDAGYALLGIFIGDTASRGKGVAQEVVPATAHWLREHRRVRQIVLGVAEENIFAIRAYQRIGFVAGPTPHYSHGRDAIVSMVWNV